MTSTDVSALIEELRAKGIDVIRVSYPDLIGVDRGRDVLLEELETTLGHGIAFCRAVYHTSPMGDVVPVQGGVESGLPDISAHPDLSTLTDLPWEPGALWCLADTTVLGGAPAEESPREVARRVRERLAELGLSAVVGPELEFYLLEEDTASPTGWKRYADAPGNVYVVGRKGDPRGVLLTMLRYLRDASLRVTAANHEFCGGQFEINLDHSDLLDAADRAFRMKSAVQEIARHEGMLATFMAKPFNDEGGSGFHLHVSLVDQDEQNLFGDPGGEHGLSEIGRYAIAGVLAHAPALAAVLNPTINSYKRFGPDTLAPWLIDWGLDNRSAMVRIPPERGAASRMEVRLGDATANPYLAIAAIGAAIYLGVRDKQEPPRPLEGYGYDPESAPKLPQSLPEALDALEADTELREVLGDFFVDSFLTYKHNETERFAHFVTDWEFREYAYHL
ncbi:glutamine synthetase family protein [Nocardioides cynanchi]|uniref:glutamine synthetase family protein n=1 Tax=Nocardioides cynanchi TaxID=2558918 RepID=UPI0012478CC9|nr:glutamine synthetase family protein [Nocardioides cynanchi]